MTAPKHSIVTIARRPRPHRLFTLPLYAALVSACAGAQHRGTEATVTSIEFEPIVIQAAVGDDGAITTTAVEISELFVEANDYLRAADYRNALRLYELLLSAVDDESYERATLYNSALALEGLERWDEAAARYGGLIDRWIASRDGADAHFRLAECLARLNRFTEVPALMERVLARIDLTLESRVEGHLRWGNALFEQRRFMHAAEQYVRALDLNQAATLRFDPESSAASAQPIPSSDSLIAHLHFALGRVYHELFSQIRLMLPEERLTRDLVDKTQLFEQAQEAYLDAVRTGNIDWAPAGGFMVGQLFEDYYFDVLATEVPEDFNAIELEVYFEELRAFIQPAMERALGVYEHNLAMAYRLGSQNFWVEDTLQALERVHAYLRDHDSWADEHRLVVERRHPHSAYYAENTEARTEQSLGN